MYKLMFAEYPDIVTVKDLQAMLGISRHAAYDLLGEGEISCIRLANAYKIPKINVINSGVPNREQPIFTDPDGHVPHPDTFTRHLSKLYRQCGLSEEYHLHTLRHFYATYLLQEGTSKQVAASLLGHADTAFLERTYCHPQDVAKQQAAKLMQDLLNNQNPCYVAFMKNKNRKAKKAG